MASHPPSECCLKKTDHEGTPIGHFKETYGLDTYVTGDFSSKKIIVIITDAFGHKFINNKLIADEFGKAGFKVYVPDILNNDAAVHGETDISKWFQNHTNEITSPIVSSFVQKLSTEQDFTFLGLVGHCFGAKFVIQNLVEGSKVTAAAVAHPSGVTIEEVAAIKKPILISAAETDPVFSPELRALSEAKLKEIGVHYQIDLFSGVVHGYAVKGDLANPLVAYAKEKTFKDQVYWFNYHAEQK